MQAQELKEKLHTIIDKADGRLLRILYSVSKEYLRATPKKVEGQKTLISQKPENGEDLFRLVYTSARTASCYDDCIDQILEASARNNPPENLTGILVYMPKRFLQILEGPYDNVMNAYERIEKDPRHGGSQIRYCQPASERHFGDWHMAHKQVVDGSIDFETAVSKEEKELYDSLMDGNLHDYKDEGMRVLKTFLMVS